MKRMGLDTILCACLAFGLLIGTAAVAPANAGGKHHKPPITKLSCYNHDYGYTLKAKIAVNDYTGDADAKIEAKGLTPQQYYSIFVDGVALVVALAEVEDGEIEFEIESNMPVGYGAPIQVWEGVFGVNIGALLIDCALE